MQVRLSVKCSVKNETERVLANGHKKESLAAFPDFVEKAETGAIVVAEGPHRPARPLHAGESNPFAESSDVDFVPDIALGHGDEDLIERIPVGGLVVRHECVHH